MKRLNKKIKVYQRIKTKKYFTNSTAQYLVSEYFLVKHQYSMS